MGLQGHTAAAISCGEQYSGAGRLPRCQAGRAPSKWRGTGVRTGEANRSSPPSDARRHLVEDRGEDVAAEPHALDGTRRQGEGGADGVIGPSVTGQSPLSRVSEHCYTARRGLMSSWWSWRIPAHGFLTVAAAGCLAIGCACRRCARCHEGHKGR